MRRKGPPTVEIVKTIYRVNRFSILVKDDNGEWLWVPNKFIEAFFDEKTGQYRIVIEKQIAILKGLYKNEN